MKTKIDYLNEMGLTEILPVGIIEKIKLKTFEKGEVLEMDAFSNGNVWKLIDGKAKMTIYSVHGGEYYGEFNAGEWIGVAATLMDLGASVVDIEAKEKIKTLIIPIREIIERYPDAMLYLWEGIARASAVEFNRVLGGTFTKVVLGNEGYFLKHLKENNGRIVFRNTRELSELLNTNLRTLQRILRKLRDEKIIGKSKHEIWVLDEEKFEEFIVSQANKD